MENPLVDLNTQKEVIPVIRFCRGNSMYMIDVKIYTSRDKVVSIASADRTIKELERLINILKSKDYEQW